MKLFDLIDAAVCEKDAPGTEAILYYTCVSCDLVNGFPQTEYELNSTDDLGDRLLLAEAFDFSAAPATEGYWRRIKIRLDSGKRMMSLLGRRTLEGKIAFTVDNTGLEQLALAESLIRANECFIFAVKQIGDEHMSIVGTAVRPAKIATLTADGGDGPETDNGTVYEVSANAPIHFYDDATLGMDITPNP